MSRFRLSLTGQGWYGLEISSKPLDSSDIPGPVVVAAVTAIAALGRPGRWWTAPQRLAIATITREAKPRPLWDRIAPLNTLDSEQGQPLSPFVAALTELVAVETSSIDRATVELITGRIGDAAYAELSAIVAQVAAIDQTCHALGTSLMEFPPPGEGEPSRLRPDGMGDAGGHIQMTEPYTGPNVARSLSLAAEDHDRWRGLVLSMYSRDGFLDMLWTDRALTRPQVELVAARTSALNECFY